ncbi:MAG: class I adenylate-forming enzyme family protein [Candidatus Omnitrophota bacterium]|nr:class I adenylate-forming enzyme family protein [Candidatus Omnitrophota bacterium]
MNIKELLTKQASLYPEKPAIIFEDKVITFSQLKEPSFRLANYFYNLRIRKPDKIALFLSNIPEAVYSYLGILSIGATLVPFDFMLTEEEIINLINHSESKILITQPKKDINLINVKNQCPTLKDIIVCKEKISGFSFWDDVLAKGQDKEPVAEIKDNDFSSIFYTSGSTGHPKGVMLTYKHLDNPVDTINHFLKVSQNDIFLTGGVPFSHIGGLDYILLMARFGSTMVLMERFHPLEFLKNLEKHKVTIFCIVPAMYLAILSLKDLRFNLSALRYAVVFGAPSSPELLKKFHEACPKAIILNGWGMTETSAPNTYSPPDDRKLSSIGSFGFKMEAKVVNEEGNKLLYGETGELWVKGEGVLVCYYKEPMLTQEAFSSDGYFKTGDLAYCKDGLIYLVGRKKDMIKVAGEIVFSYEVEEKIQSYPKVKEVAVIGVPDKLRGEVPKAFIVPRENRTIDPQELKDYLKLHLAHFKIPHYFEFLQDLPKNRVGKIDKTKLEADERGSSARGGSPHI